jgi:GWxTD domain-containing protein
MKRLFFVLFCLHSVSYAQSIRDINFSQLYDPGTPFALEINPIRKATGWLCQYTLTLRDTTKNVQDYSLQFEIRNSISEQNGTVIPLDSSVTQNRRSQLTGSFSVPLSAEFRYVVGRVITSTEMRPYFVSLVLEPKYPVTEEVVRTKNPSLDRFIKTGEEIRFPAGGQFIVSYYNDNFPTAPVPFSEALGKVSKQMKVDSTFVVNGEGIALSKTGLYLIQKDTLKSEGIAFRVEEDYPRYARLKNLANPMIYICTSNEFEKIKAAKGEKKAFDKVILGITKDTERAKKFMKSYFRRVEWANELFTSYKEGWKTDRGMIYVIFGPPDEVYRSTDREIWNYKRPEFKTNFEFVRSPSLFDPHNYALVRDRKYTQLWYEVIDLWRNARF